MINKINDINKKLDRLNDALFNKRVSVRMAKLARSIVYKRTKAGKGVNGEQNTKLKGLSPEYVDWRKTVAKRKRVGQRSFQAGKFFKPAKSNLTFTGQLLESMIIDAGRYNFGVIIPNTKRKRLGKEKKIKTNSEVAGYVEANGREFFALSKGEVRIILKEYEKIIRQIIRKEGL